MSFLDWTVSPPCPLPSDAVYKAAGAGSAGIWVSATSSELGDLELSTS